MQLFIRPLRNANPPIIRSSEIDEFIDEVFGNILDLRETNRRLLEQIYVRQREQSPVIQGIGDIFLEAATEFRVVYPNYVGNLPVGEKRMKDELEKNAEFKRFVEVCRLRHPQWRHMLSVMIAMFETPRRTPVGPEAFPQQAVRAPAEVSGHARGDQQRDYGGQP